MARIFLSHSSRDNPQAVALRDWLTAEGWQDLFLDLDPSHGIAAGERWERRLHEAANRCEAVLFLVSRAWLASDWCLREFRLAQKLNKRSFGILIEPIPLAELPAELTAHWQFVDLAQGADHRIFRAVQPDGSESHVTFSTAGIKRLKAGLTRAGLDARFFAWPPDDDPNRPPYRGMRPLEAEDAGIFFGREAPTIEALDRLRGLSEAAAPRFMVILGASGAGKSSFLRAGLLPRLARDDRAFLPLPIVRPERAAISGDTGLIRSLEAAAASAELAQSRAGIKAAIEDGAPAVAAFLAAMAEKVRAPAGTSETRPHPPRIVLAIDQAEELFLAEGAAEAGTFLRLVRDLAADPASNLIVIATIRSDAYERLQTAPALEGVRQEAVSLPPMPRGAYQTVIEGPAARLAETRRPLKVEPALTAALLHDVEQGGAKDALPLLAFTLERLYLEHGGDGDLRLSEYRQVGGIRGSIDAAVEGALRGADSDPAVPRDRAAREALLRRALIPWLAGIDPETGAPRRRIARLSEIPEEARPLVTHLVASRLLATDRNPDTGETTVEPAHEALLRQWGLLQGWLEEDFAALSTLEGVRRAARDWEANARAGDWLAHAAGRLDDAEALLARDDFAASLDPTDRAYLAAARAADTARRDRELAEARKLAAAEKQAAESARDATEKQRTVARRTRIGLVAASVLAVLAIGAALYGVDQSTRAVRNLDFALDATDNLAVATAQGLEATFDTPATEKVRVIRDLDASFGKLVQSLGSDIDLRARYAEVLVASAFTLFNVGRDDLAEDLAARASRMLFEEGDLTISSQLRARVRLALAIAQMRDLEFVQSAATLDQADAHYAAGDSLSSESIALQAPIVAARAELLGTWERWEEASLAADAAIVLAETSRKTAAEGGPSHRIAAMLLLQMEWLKMRCAWYTGDLPGARPDKLLQSVEAMRFDQGDDALWRYYEAIGAQAEALHLSTAGNPAAAVETVTPAIDTLHALVEADPGNLAWRNRLALALLERSYYSFDRQDTPQATLDLDAVRKIVSSTERDGGHPNLTARANLLALWHAGRLEEASERYGDALASYRKLIDRIEHYESELGDFPSHGYVGAGHAGVIRALVAQKKYEEALVHAEEILAVSESIANAYDAAHPATLKMQVYYELFAISDKDALGARWDEFLDRALLTLDEVDRLDPDGLGDSLINRSYLLSLRAQRLAESGRHAEAVIIREQMQELYYKSLDMAEAGQRSAENISISTRNLVASLAALGRIDEGTSALLELLGRVGELDFDDPAARSAWASLAARLDTIVAEATPGGGDLAAFRDAAAEVKRVNDTLKDTGDSADAQVVPTDTEAELAKLDPRTLDVAPLSTGKANNTLTVSSALGPVSRSDFQTQWRNLADAEFDDAAKMFQQFGIDSARIKWIRSSQLPFYEEGWLFEAERVEPQGTVVTPVLMVRAGPWETFGEDFSLFDDGSSYLLDGTSPPIHDANANAPIRIKDHNDAAAYLRFFGAYLAGPDGVFQIIESARDLPWATNSSPELMRTVGRVVRPLIVWPAPDRPDHWRASATVRYSNAIFHAIFEVKPTGLVEMIGDSPVSVSLPLSPPLADPTGRIQRVVHNLDLTFLDDP